MALTTMSADSEATSGRGARRVGRLAAAVKSRGTDAGMFPCSEPKWDDPRSFHTPWRRRLSFLARARRKIRSCGCLERCYKKQPRRLWEGMRAFSEIWGTLVYRNALSVARGAAASRASSSRRHVAPGAPKSARGFATPSKARCRYHAEAAQVTVPRRPRRRRLSPAFSARGRVQLGDEETLRVSSLLERRARSLCTSGFSVSRLRPAASTGRGHRRVPDVGHVCALSPGLSNICMEASHP